MYAEVDFKEIGKDIEITCGPDEIYIMWRFIKEKWKDGSKLILSERLAELWEGWDSGPAPGSYRTRLLRTVLCEFYFARFYIHDRWRRC